MKRISTPDTLTYWIPIFALLLALLTGCGGGGGGGGDGDGGGEGGAGGEMLAAGCVP